MKEPLTDSGDSKRIRTQSEMFAYERTENRQVPFPSCRYKCESMGSHLFHPGSSRPLQPWSQYLRDIILGVNDGLVSMFLIVFGMFGGGALARSILLAGITGAIAGAISMGLGEYIATKSQLEIMVSDVSRERYELAVYGMLPSTRSGLRFLLKMFCVV